MGRGAGKEESRAMAGVCGTGSDMRARWDFWIDRGGTFTDVVARNPDGTLIGAPLAGRVVIVDDVISAGTSVGESVEIIRSQGAKPVAVLIALDQGKPSFVGWRTPETHRGGATPARRRLSVAG